MTRTIDIVIVGGGMMGTTLSLLLGKVLPNNSICLIDKSTFDVTQEQEQELSLPSFDARSTALAPTTVELMRHIGVWQTMAPFATAIKNVRVSDRGHSGWTRLTEQDNAGEPLGQVVENRAIGCALVSAASALETIELRSGLDVEHLQPVSGGFQIRLSDGSLLKTGLLLIADGAASALGQSLGVQQNIKDYAQSAIVANVKFERAHGGAAFERFTDKGPLALLPLGGDKGSTSALVWTWPKNDVDKVMSMTEKDFLAELQKCFGYRLGNFTKVSSRSSYPLKLCLAAEQVRSNLVMMGNAAHFLHPVAGQGFNLGARDALRLAETLKDSEAPLGDLSTLMRYQQAQTSDQFRTILLSHGFNTLFGSSNLALIGLRNIGMLAVENCNLIRNVFIRQMSGRANPKVLL